MERALNLRLDMKIKHMGQWLGNVSLGTYNRLLEHDSGRSNGWRVFL